MEGFFVATRDCHGREIVVQKVLKPPFGKSPAVVAACIAVLFGGGQRVFANAWVGNGISFVAGSGPKPDYISNPNVTLGSPERISVENTPFPPFLGGVTMFAGAYGVDEIVSIGAGGSLVVQFDEPIDNDPAN